MIDFKEIERIKGRLMAGNICNANVEYLLSSITALREQLAEQAKRADDNFTAYDRIKTKYSEAVNWLAQVEKERDDARQKLMRRCTHPNTYPLEEATRRCHDCGAEILL